MEYSEYLKLNDLIRVSKEYYVDANSNEYEVGVIHKEYLTWLDQVQEVC
jgi:hypothetical protein